MKVMITKWRRDVTRTRLGFVDLRLPDIGLSIRGAMVHRFDTPGGHSAFWVAMPGRDIFHDGHRQTYVPVFFTRHIHEQLADEVLRQLKAEEPDLFAARKKVPA
jgi:hypothetical protein